MTTDSVQPRSATVDPTDPTHPSSPQPTDTSWPHRLSRKIREAGPAAWVFAAYLVAGGAYWLLIEGRGRWFHADEWQALADPAAGELSTLLQDHFQHWITLPLLAYRVLFEMFGVTTYLPYRALALAVHLAVVILVRLVMRRSGVTPWPATILAGVLVVFGPGSQNIVWAYQITMTGAVMFGLTQLILADHPGTTNRRDWLGLGAGLLALMCSGVGLAMVAVVGVATLIRRGWRAAAFHTVPLALVFVTWWLLVDPDDTDVILRPTLSQLPLWLATAWASAFEALSYFPILAAVLAAITAWGYIVAWRGLTLREFRSVASLPVALASGLAVFPILIFPSRAGLGPEMASSSRYLYIYCVFLIPVVGYGVNALILRWRWTAIVLAIPLIAIPFNATASGFFPPSAFVRSKVMIQALAASPKLADAPGSLVPDPAYWLGEPGVSVEWLRAAAADGSIAIAPDQITPAAAAEAALRLSLSQSQGEPDPASCRGVDTGSRQTTLRPGASLGFTRQEAGVGLASAWILDVRPARAGVAGVIAKYTTSEGHLLTNVSELPLRLEVSAADGRPWSLCR